MNGSAVSLRHGTEGPRHDPYAFTEVTVKRADGREITAHTGLALWLKVKLANGRFVEVEYHSPEDQKRMWDLFEFHADITIKSAETAFYTRKQNRIRHHGCGRKHLQWVDGYPGESLLHCVKCGDILDAAFDKSAIE